MTQPIQLTVNGSKHDLHVEGGESLLQTLRDRLQLTGAKNGCDGSGTCGACTILLDGEPKKSCQLLTQDLAGCSIRTIEGLSSGDRLHPIQEAFIDCGAVQCGYCTPGMVLRSVALLEKTPNPTREEVRKALNESLCRCTGYTKIIDAVLAVSRSPAQLDSSSAIGASMRRPDAAGKVTGRAKYGDDCHTSEDLILRVVWSPMRHGAIQSIDVEEARRLPGVVDVLTAGDIPGLNAYGLINKNQPVLCDKRVRHLGDPVALVVAENETAADEGRKAVRVLCDPLPAYTDPQESLEPGSVSIHDDGNVCCEFRMDCGETETAMDGADLCVSGVFETPAVEHAYMEPEAGFAFVEGDAVVVCAGSQYPETIRDQIAEVLALPSERVQIATPAIGGAFGGKTDISVHALLALAAWRTRRRVRLTWTRAESLRASVKRHAMSLNYRIGLTQQGEITAIEADIVANAGAYESLSDPLLEQTAVFATGPYRIPAAQVRVRGVYTNTPTTAAFRGFGIPQPTFAVESLLDEAARKLGLTPLELRLRNALEPGDRSWTGQTMGPDTHLVDALEALRAPYEQIRETMGANEGVGLACGYKNVGLGLGESDHASATLRAHPDGRLLVLVGSMDVGQGSETIAAQLASDALGVPIDRIDVTWGDTARTPDGRETNASRQTVVTGNAVLMGAACLRERLMAHVANHSKEAGTAAQQDESGRFLDWNQTCATLEQPLEASAQYVAPETVPLGPFVSGDGRLNYFAFTFFANLASVLVDPSRGSVRVKRLISAYDVGRVIHRQAAEGQIEGGAAMGVGFALSEQFVPTGDGETVSLAQCQLPRCSTLPDAEALFVEHGDSVGPHGSKGLGEVAMIAVAPSITNAIRDAIGVRIRSLPARPADIRSLIDRSGGQS